MLNGEWPIWLWECEFIQIYAVMDRLDGQKAQPSKEVCGNAYNNGMRLLVCKDEEGGLFKTNPRR